MAGSDPLSFAARPTPGGSGNRRRPEVLVAVAIVAFVVLGVVKPWGEPPPPTDLAGRGPTPGVSASGPILPTSPVQAPPAAPDLSALRLALPGTAARSIDGWGALDWARVQAGDATPYLTSVLAWRGGFVALGRLPDAIQSSVWTSADGVRWQPLPFGTSSGFWPGSSIVGLAEVETGLVAVVAPVGPCGVVNYCAPAGPIMGWTSADGVTWTPGGVPDLGPRIDHRGVVATATPNGVLAVSAGEPVSSATTRDGEAWSASDATGMGPATVVRDAADTGFGVLVAGADGGGPDARPTVWLSQDGTAWTPSTLAGTGQASEGRTGAIVASLAAGRDGVVAHVVGAGVDPDGWWQTSDGRTWRLLPTEPPRGPWLFGIDHLVIGDLVAGDGSRILAVRGDPFPVAWISGDGQAWRQIPVRGELPSGSAQRAFMVPGGLLVIDGTSAWLGTASTE